MSEQKDDDLVAGDAVEGDGVVGDAVVGDAVVSDAVAGDGVGAVDDVGVDGAGVDGAATPVAPSKQLRLRRAPRYGAFGFTGMFVGIVIGVVLALSFPVVSNYSTQTIVGYFAAIFGLLGGVLGLGVAVLVERPRS